METNFDRVSYMNEKFLNPKGDSSNPDWNVLLNQSKNILDEYNELIDDGIQPKDMKEVRDALCDILVFTYGAAHLVGVDIDKDMVMVYESNMSKFCEDQVTLDATIAKYQAIGVEVRPEGEFPYAFVRSTKYQTDIYGKEYQENKFLKGVNFFEPKFD